MQAKLCCNFDKRGRVDCFSNNVFLKIVSVFTALSNTFLLSKPFVDDNNNDPMLKMAIARIRQLSAHEVGHTIGFAHNFAASTNNRSSVMDYPHPLIKITNDEIDLSEEIISSGLGSSTCID